MSTWWKATHLRRALANLAYHRLFQPYATQFLSRPVNAFESCRSQEPAGVRIYDFCFGQAHDLNKNVSPFCLKGRYEQNEPQIVCKRRRNKRRRVRNLGNRRQSGKSAARVHQVGLETRRIQPTGEESCAVQAAVRHYPDCEWQLPEQHQKLAEWAALRFRHTGRTDQDCCCAAGYEHPGAAAPGSEAAGLPYGDRGAGASPDWTQQPETATGRDREGDAGAHVVEMRTRLAGRARCYGG